MLWAPALVYNTGNHLSNLSHVGGFACGVALGLGMIRRVVPKKLQAFVPVAMVSLLILMLIVVPSLVYGLVLSGISCDQPSGDMVYKSIPS